MIVSISEAIEESQEELKTSKTIVVPNRVDSPDKNGNITMDYKYEGTNRIVQQLEFDVSVSVDNKDSTGGKGAIKVMGVLEIGGGKTNENVVQHQNRLKFKIPVAFSPDQKQR